MDRRAEQALVLNSASKTEDLGFRIGQNLKGGEVIELISDLGGGKTTFTRGLARGAGSHDHVSSPSFTIRNDYQAKDMAIAHFDFYRLSEPGMLKEMLSEAMIDPDTAVVIEWGQIVDDVLPVDHVKIELKATKENQREVSINYPQRFEYLFNGVF